MADELTEEEWRELLAYLMDQLRELRADDTLAEIATSTSEPVKQSLTPDQEQRLNLLKKTGLSRSRVRPQSPQERFAAAIEVLRARLVELPAVLRAVERHFAAPVEFVDEATEDQRPDEFATVRVREVLSSPELREEELSDLLFLAHATATKTPFARSGL